MSPQSPDNLDLQHLQEMRQRTKERLYKLQESLASFGMDAPSHLRIDAERAQKDLELIEARMQTIGPSPEVTATIGVEGRMTVVEWRMNGLADKLADALTYFGDQLAIVREEAREWRESERRAREERILHAYNGFLYGTCCSESCRVDPGKGPGKGTGKKA